MAAHGTDAEAKRENAATPPQGTTEGLGRPEGELGRPGDEDLGMRGRRDELASLRDEAAKVRDQLAVQRDIDADIADQRVLDLEGNNELLDRRTVHVQELRARGKTG